MMVRRIAVDDDGIGVGGMRARHPCGKLKLELHVAWRQCQEGVDHKKLKLTEIKYCPARMRGNVNIRPSESAW